jgi:plastocyanin
MTKALILIILFNIIYIPNTIRSEDLIFEINIKDHHFLPESITIPEGVKVTLIVNNQDSTIEEFESFELRKEKIIPSKGSRKITIGPLKPGVYSFFGEFHPKTAQGKLIVK